MTGVPGGLKAALCDRYAIEREIGSGCMATVYLAEGLQHHHQVPDPQAKDYVHGVVHHEFKPDPPQLMR